MNTNFPIVEVRYRIEIEGVGDSHGRLLVPADEWAALDAAGRHEYVRSAAVAARVKTTWDVEAGEAIAAPRRRLPIPDPSAN